MEYGAILILGHFVMSIFQVPLGNPMWQFVPYPNMEVCQSHIQYHQTPQGGYQISTEHRMFKQVQCMTRAEFEAEMARQRSMEQGTPPPNQGVPDGPMTKYIIWR